MSTSISAAPTTPTVGAHRVPSTKGGTHTVNVTYDGTLNCTCPDFLYRKADLMPTITSPRGHYCKHCAAVIAEAAGAEPVGAPKFSQYTPRPRTRRAAEIDVIGSAPEAIPTEAVGQAAGSEAAQLAGFACPSNTTNRMLKKDEIEEEIKHRTAEIAHDPNDVRERSEIQVSRPAWLDAGGNSGAFQHAPRRDRIEEL